MFLRRNTLVAAHSSAAFIAETGTRGGTLDTVKKLRQLQRPIFATCLPPDHPHHKAHQLLTASGAELLAAGVTQQMDTLAPLYAAAEQTLRRPHHVASVLDDLFPHEPPHAD